MRESGLPIELKLNKETQQAFREVENNELETFTTVDELRNDLNDNEAYSFFQKDFKRHKNKHYDMLKLKKVIQLIINKETKILRVQHKNPLLKGQWQNYRELHIEND